MRTIQLSKALLVLASLLLFLLFSAACVQLPRHQMSASRASEPVAATQNSPKNPPININTATALELEKLPGIGAALAARIVEHRERYGPFRRAEHLIMVRGISDRRFREMRALITVE